MAEEVPHEEDPEVLAIAARCTQALRGFGVLNAALGAGENGYAPPDEWPILGQLMAVSNVLVAAGILSQRDMVLMTLSCQADILEGSLRAAAEAKRQQTGLIIPGVFPLDARQQG